MMLVTKQFVFSVSCTLAAVATYIFVSLLFEFIQFTGLYLSLASMTGFLESLSSDGIDWDYVAYGAALILGFSLTAAVSVKKPTLLTDERVRYWTQTIIRYSLAAVFLEYGFSKIFHNQFYSFSSTLDTPLGDVTGIQLTWRFFGYSYAYTLFVASFQILGAVLLLFRRTVTLAAIVLLPVISNIVFINFSHNIPVRLYSIILLSMVLYLVLLEYKGLKALFWDHKPFDGSAFQAFVSTRPRLLIKSVVIVLALTTAVCCNYFSYALASKAKGPLSGAWEVQEYRVNGASASNHPTWKKVYFESDVFVAIKSDEPRPRLFFSELDPKAHTIRLNERMGGLTIEGSYELLSPDSLEINGTQGTDAIQVALRRLK